MRESGARVTINWMREQLQMYFGIESTESGMSRALAGHNICHKKLTILIKAAFMECNVALTHRLHAQLAFDQVVHIFCKRHADNSHI